MNKKWYGALFVLFSAGLTASVLLRTCLILYAVDPKTGFYVEGSTLVSSLNILLIVFTAILLIPFLMKDRQKSSLPVHSSALSTVSFLLAVSMLLDAVLQLGQVIFGSGGAGVFLSGITEAIASITFFSLGTQYLSVKKASHWAVSLLPVVWSAFHLITTFMHYTTIANISEYLFDIVRLVFVLLFLYCHARLTGNVKNYKQVNGLFACGLPAALYSGLSTLPHYFAYFSGTNKGSLPTANDAVYLILSIYILILLASLVFGKTVKPQPTEKAE